MDKRHDHRVQPIILARARELRHPQTAAEARLWTRLRNAQLGGYKFRRQHPIGRFIVDFYCARCRLIVEINGDSHSTQPDYDETRTEWLTQEGYHVLRFWNSEVMNNTEGVLETLLDECRRLAPPSP